MMFFALVLLCASFISFTLTSTPPVNVTGLKQFIPIINQTLGFYRSNPTLIDSAEDLASELFKLASSDDSFFDHVSADEAQSYLSFLYMFSSGQDWGGLRKLSHRVFPYFSTNQLMTEQFLSDLVAGFRPTRSTVSCFVDNSMHLHHCDTRTHVRQYMDKVAQYIDEQEMLPDSFDTMNYVFFLMALSLGKYGLKSESAFKLLPGLYKVVHLLEEEHLEYVIRSLVGLVAEASKNEVKLYKIIDLVITEPFVSKLRSFMNKPAIRREWCRFVSYSFEAFTVKHHRIAFTENFELLDAYQSALKRETAITNMLSRNMENFKIIARSTSMDQLLDGYKSLTFIDRCIDDVLSPQVVEMICCSLGKLADEIAPVILAKIRPDIDEGLILLHYEISSFLLKHNHKNNLPHYMFGAIIFGGRALTLHPDSELLKEHLFHKMTPANTTAICESLLWSIDSGSLTTMKLSDSILITEYCKKTESPELIRRMNIALMDIVPWRQGETFVTAMRIFHNTNKDVFALIILRKIERMNPSELEAVKYFIRCSKSAEFITSTQEALFNALLQ